MNSRLIRVLIVVIGLAVGFAASYFLKDLEQKLTTERASTDVLRDRARTLQATIADVRASQVAYVAQGQGEDFWMGRVAKLLPVLDGQMADLSGQFTGSAAQAAFEPAAAAVENFQKLDSRARDFAKGNSLLASDLIFSDGLEATATATAQIEAALNAELAVRQVRMAGQRTEQLRMLAGSGGAILLLLLLLGLTGATPKAQPAEEPVEQPAQPPMQTVRPVKQNLTAAAAVCSDLARVVEPRHLPALLKRTADAMDASGIIVWVADAAGQDLRPAMFFGYSHAVIARMGSIPRDATNAAAAAYRSREMRTVSGDGSANGALVAPLVTADGCFGVLCAEMKGGAEQDEGSQALAMIFAAQLATLVATPAAVAPAKTAAQS